MKTQYSILSAVFAFILFTSPLAAQVGTPWDLQINSPGRFQVFLTERQGLCGSSRPA